MDRLETLEALEEIRALKARYFRTLDTKDWAGYQAVFTADVVADFREATATRDESQFSHGADAYVRPLAAMLQDVVTVHHGHMAEIEVISPTLARGVWAMEDKLWPASTSVLPFRWLHGYGHYHERYVKQNDRWRIAEIRLTRLRVDVG